MSDIQKHKDEAEVKFLEDVISSLSLNLNPKAGISSLVKNEEAHLVFDDYEEIILDCTHLQMVTNKRIKRKDHNIICKFLNYSFN
jgi:hypothetical protein